MEAYWISLAKPTSQLDLTALLLGLCCSCLDCACQACMRWQRELLMLCSLARRTLSLLPSSTLHRPKPRTMIHTFASLGLERTGPETREPDFLPQALASPSSRFLLVHGTSVLFQPGDAPNIAWQTMETLKSRLQVRLEDLLPRTKEDAQHRDDGKVQTVVLGSETSGDDRAFVCAVDVTHRDKEQLEAILREAGRAHVDVRFENTRQLLAVMGGGDIAMCGLSAALLSWHRINLYCGACGSPTVSVEGGSRRQCSKCRNRQYPRIDPVCIVMVVDPLTDRCLLGRQRIYRPGMYSCLAGYVEQCESLEEAIAREVKEEAGIELGALRYHSSQPWPVGRGASCQLMVGFIAEAISTDVNIDQEELEDARWFTREEVASAKELYATATQNPGERSSTDAEGVLSIPGPYAIAHHLIKHWLNNPPRHRL